MGGYTSGERYDARLNIERRKRICEEQAGTLGKMSISGLKVNPEVIENILMRPGRQPIAVSLGEEPVEVTQVVAVLQAEAKLAEAQLRAA